MAYTWACMPCMAVCSKMENGMVELCGRVFTRLGKKDLALFQMMDMRYVAVGKLDLATAVQ